ncbi:MAG: hypothetical protein AAGA92_07780, partial [Planctomycetota bacterium]
ATSASRSFSMICSVVCRVRFIVGESFPGFARMRSSHNTRLNFRGENHDRNPDIYEAFVQLACGLIAYKRLIARRF